MCNLQRYLTLAATAIVAWVVPACAQTIDTIEINQSIGKLYDGTANTNFVAGKATVGPRLHDGGCYGGPQSNLRLDRQGWSECHNASAQELPHSDARR